VVEEEDEVVLLRFFEEGGTLGLVRVLELELVTLPLLDQFPLIVVAGDTSVPRKIVAEQGVSAPVAGH
jgi:hypothetical protein